MKSMLQAAILRGIPATILSVFSLFNFDSVSAQSNHSVTFTGSAANFNAAEVITAAAGNTDYYVTYDANSLYIGAFRTSGSFATSDNLTIYLDTDPNSTPTSGTGTTTGQSYNGVDGTLPFTANYNVHAEESYQEARSEAGGWSSTISGLTYNTGSTWREIAIPFSSIGSPDALYLTMWMGYAGGIYSNAPGADLGSGANPTVIGYVGGFGVSSVDCIPVNTTNSPITASIVNGVPAAGVTYGKVSVTSGSFTATNNFNVAAGGSIQVTGGSLDISGRTINFGNAISGGQGTTINQTSGSLITSAGTNLIFQGEGLITGSALTLEGNTRINNKFTPQASGSTTIGTSGILDIRSGGYVNTNAVTYSTGSTLKYNTGASFTASTEWAANATSGTGVPSNVTIGDAVANSVLSFGSSSSYRHSNGNVTISSGTSGSALTLSSASGGDLSLTGNFAQNGTFTHNNRSVTFNGTIAQGISGSLNTSGATNNFRSLIINNSGGSITLNNDAKITATSGDVLQLLNASTLDVASGIALTIEGNGGNVYVNSGASTVNLISATSSLNFTGTKVVTAAGGTLNILSSANGKVNVSAAVNFGNLITTIGNNTTIEFLSGGSVNTNPPTYASGSTLSYNSGGTFTAGSEWQTNTTSGSGIPYNVLIGNGVNTTLSFGTSSQYRHANQNVTVSASSGLTLSSAAGGNLQLAGDFVQNGTFTHNNRSATFNGTSAQGISGSLNSSGATNNFPYLIINNANVSGVTINSDVLVSQTSGDVLQLINNGPLNIAATRTLTLGGAGGNIRVTGGARTINFNAATSAMNITGTKTVAATAGTLSITSTAANGVLNLGAAVNFGSSLTTIGNNTYLQINSGGSVTTNAPSYATGSTLVYNSGGTFTAATEWSANTTSGVGVPSNVLIGNGVNTTLSFGASAQYRHANGNVSVTASSGLTLSSAAGGNLQLRGDFSNSGTFTANSRNVTLNGTSAQQSITGTTTFSNLILDNTNGALLNSSITVSSVFTLTNGSLTLGSNNISLSSNATGAIAGYNSSRMVITNGSGQLIRAIATSGTNTYVYPVGETTGTTEYSPASFTFSANGAARNLGVRVVDANHSSLDSSPTQTDYISRYWATSNSAASTYTYTAAFTYPAADLNGAESNVRVNMWNGSAWTHVAASSSSSNVLSITSSVTNATLPLSTTAEFTGRVNNGTTYTWNTTGGSWATAGNWTPSRSTPAANDILIFNNTSTYTVTNVPTQTIGQLLLNNTANITFQPASAGNVLTIAGGNGTDFNIASGGTLNLSHATNQMTIEFANSTVSTIAGTLALSGDTANEFDCTNSSVTVTGSINSASTVTSTASNLSFASGSNYRHNHTTSAGSLPNATWDVASTCTIQGYTSNTGAPGNLGQAFGNFTWNCTAQSEDIDLGEGLTTINGNFTVSSTGGSTGDDLILGDDDMVLNVGGNMSISGTNTELRLADSNGSYTVEVNVAGNYSQSTSTSILNLNNGDEDTGGILRVGGTFNFSAGTITQTSGEVNADNRIEFTGTAAQTVTIAGTFSNEINFRVNNTVGINLTGTIPILQNCTFYRTNGTITGGTINYDGTDSYLFYDGSTNMTTGTEWPTSNDPENVTINSSAIISLGAARTLENDGVFTELSGIFSLGAFDLTISNTATGGLVNATPSSSNMIAADGAGQLKRAIPSGTTSTYNFPIGDITGTAEYSGISIDFSSNSAARNLGFRVVDGDNPNDSTATLPAIDYTTRTWYSTLSVTTGTYSYTPTLSYNVAGDVQGTEYNMLVSNWTGSAWASRASLVTAGSPNSTITTTSTVSQSTLSLNNAEILGRAPVKYWTGDVSDVWSNGSNWVPSGAPVSSDNIEIAFYTNYPCVLGTGSATINHLTLSGTGDFTLSSGASLTVAGNLTYDNPASAIFSCGSTLTLSNSVYPQNVPAIDYGSLNIAGGTRILASSDTIRICNNYTPTTGTLTTTGSTVEFNGTAAQSILTNSTSFNNLSVINTGGTVSASNNVSVSGQMSVVANARYNQSASTLTLSSGSTANIFGYLRNGNTITATGTLTVKSTGVYEHNTTTPGTIPTATWENGSTCELIGNFSSGNLACGSQSFHHFKVNYSGSGDVNTNESLTTVNGDLTIQSTGSGEFALSNSGATTMNIGGNLTQTGGDWLLATSNNTDFIINLTGDFSQTSGDLDFYSGGGNATAEINLDGNYSRTGNGTVTASGSGTTNGLFNFSGVNQTITETSSGQNRWIDYDIESGSTTTLLSDLNIYGSGSYVATIDVNSGGVLDFGTYVVAGTSDHRVNINSGGTARTANTNGFAASAASGSIQVTTRTYNSGATYVYNGSSNQNTGNFFTVASTANSIANLTLSNTASTVTFNSTANITVSNALNFSATNSANLDMSTYTLSVSNTSAAAVVRSNTGHVIGNLRRGIATGSNTYVFHVGTSGGYSPASLALNTVTGSGNITVRATAGAHPNAATHGLSLTRYLNRYWTITNTGTTITGSATVNTFDYPAGDLIGGATSSSLKLVRWNGTAWSYPTSSTGSNQISGSALNNTTVFGDFFAADCGSFSVDVTPSSATLCNGGSVGLVASASFGSPTYLWTPATGLSATNVASVTANPSTTQVYTVTATTATNCSADTTVTVTVNPRPTGVISGTQTICNGGSASLSIVVTGTGPWSGTLSNGDPFSGSSSPISVSVNPSSSITYTIATLLDANCTANAGDKTGSAAVTVNARPTGVISGTQTICNGTTASLSIAVTGVGPWSGTLSNGDPFSGSSSPISVSVNPSSSITYTIATLSSSQCAAIAGDLSGSAAVTVNARPTGVLSGTQTICNGGSASLSVAVTGTGPWSGTLSNGDPFSGSSSPISVSVSPSSTTTLTIATLSDSNCSANAGDLSGSAVVTVNARPTGVIGGSQTMCAGGSAPIFINVTGSGTISGTLSPGSIPFSGTAPTIILSVAPGSNTTYTIATLSDANCSSIAGDLTGSAAIVVHPLPTAGISGTTSVCSGSSTTVSFTGTANAMITYTINGGSNQFITLDGSGNASLNTGAVVVTTTYALVSVNDGTCGNSASGNAVVTPLDLPESDISGTTSICSGGNATISFSGTPGAIVTYTINAGPNQFITLNGSGLANFNTGALTSTTTYLLVSVSDGTCSQNIGMSAVVTVTGATYYQDSDGDGFGNPLVSVSGCTAPMGYVLDNTDCCDTNADLNPGTEWWADVDGDGFGGFVYDYGCLIGVTCSSGTWPAQSIPYYPGAHGGAPYVLDCNDSNINIYPGAVELCNNAADDDCDGTVNEGCSAIVNDNWTSASNVNLTNPNTHFPNCFTLNGTLVNANISPQGNSSNVPMGAGRDVWYRFVAPSTGVQIKVIPNGFDAIIELQNSSAVELNSESANATSGGQEILNFNSLNAGDTYYIGVRNHDISVGGTFTICVSPLMPSGCSYATPVGGFTLCSNFKAAYRAAANYTFSFTGTGGNAAFPFVTTSATTTGLVPLSTPALDMRHGGIYSVRIDANYALFNGVGTPEPIMTVLGSIASMNCSGVTMAAQPSLEVRSSQSCPATLMRNQYLIGDPVSGNPLSCSAINYTFEFTKVSDCTGATVIGLPFEVTTSGNTPYLMLASAFPTAQLNIGYWRVRVRPNYSYMTGTYGPNKVIGVNGSSASQMLPEPQFNDETERSLEFTIESNIYPNPNQGDMMNIRIDGDVQGELYMRIVNSVGQLVMQKMYVSIDELNAPVVFDQQLTNGFYLVEITAGGKTFSHRMLVQK